MNDRQQKQNDSLAHCIRHDPTGELHKGEERIQHALREECCLRRAMWFMGFLTALAALGLGFSVVLLYEVAPYYTRLINHILTVMGLASLISLMAFTAFWIQSRHRLSALREELRRLLIKLLAEQSGAQNAPKNPSPALNRP